MNCHSILFASMSKMWKVLFHKSGCNLDAYFYDKNCHNSRTDLAYSFVKLQMQYFTHFYFCKLCTLLVILL